MDLELNIKPVVSHGLTHNVLRVSVSYDKSNTGPIARLQMAEVGPPENGFQCFKVALFGSPSARVSVEKGWKTNNKKRMEAAYDQVRSEIAGKRGDTYAAVVKLLTDNGSEIVEPAAEHRGRAARIMAKRAEAAARLRQLAPWATARLWGTGSPGCDCHSKDRENQYATLSYTGERLGNSHYCHGCGAITIARGDKAAWEAAKKEHHGNG